MHIKGNLIGPEVLNTFNNGTLLMHSGIKCWNHDMVSIRSQLRPFSHQNWRPPTWKSVSHWHIGAWRTALKMCLSGIYLTCSLPVAQSYKLYIHTWISYSWRGKERGGSLPVATEIRLGAGNEQDQEMAYINEAFVSKSGYSKLLWPRGRKACENIHITKKHDTEDQQNVKLANLSETRQDMYNVVGCGPNHMAAWILTKWAIYNIN